MTNHYPEIGVDMAKLDDYTPAASQNKMGIRRIQYGQSFYNSTDLKDYAEQYLVKLPSDVTHLISRGASGCTIASAMLALSQRPLKHLFIRKGEKAHSSDYTGYAPVDLEAVGAFVDDFVAYGETAQYVLEWDNNNKNKIKYILVHRLDFSLSATINLAQQCTDMCITIITVEEK